MNAVRNVFLGVFDPTMLLNDQYIVRVTATDVDGRTGFGGILLNVAGDLKLGQFRLEFTDLSIPVSGIPIQVRRVYDTRQSSRVVGGDGQFG